MIQQEEVVFVEAIAYAEELGEVIYSLWRTEILRNPCILYGTVHADEMKTKSSEIVS